MKLTWLFFDRRCSDPSVGLGYHLTSIRNSNFDYNLNFVHDFFRTDWQYPAC